MSRPKTPILRFSRRRVLVVTPFPPYPLDRGGNVRLDSLCRRLRDTHDFHLITFADPDLLSDRPAAEALRLGLSTAFETAELVPLSASGLRRLWNRYHRPFAENRDLWEPLGEKIQSAIRLHEPDLVHIEHIQMAPCRRYVRGVPAVLTEHDVGWTWPFRGVSPFHARESFEWLRRYLFFRRAVSAFQGVVVTGEGDFRWWRRWGPGRVPAAMVPTGVDLEKFEFRSREPSGPENDVLFIGHFSHPPNAAAARRFLTFIWPEVKRAVPRVRATFVGPCPPDWLRAAADERFRVTGAVPDVRPYLRKARVFIAPHRQGGGIKGKILEAFAAGVPVAATPLAMEGFPDSARSVVVTARGAKHFAKALENLLKNTALRRETAERARRWVERHGNWANSADLLDRFYRDVLASSRRNSDSILFTEEARNGRKTGDLPARQARGLEESRRRSRRARS